MKSIMVKVVQLFLLVGWLSHSSSSDPASGVQYIDYCVVGAGPSGLQMGYFLQRAGRDYVVFERANVSGAFYTKYPRHDILISINKRHTGKTNKEFNFRHDWNSLISDDESLQMRHYSKKMFPHRETYVRYLNDYQKKLGIRVQHNTDIRNLRKNGVEKDASFSMEDQHGNAYRCNIMIMANGMSSPNVPKNFKGSEYTDSYDSMSLNPEDYEGKSVLIVGRGNSAFEVADSLYGSTSFIHMVARSRVRLSWETHYVGDTRAVNNALLDTYQLKSLDGVLEAAIEDIGFVKDSNGKLWLKSEDGEDESPELDNFALREPYDKVILCTGFKFNDSAFDSSLKPEMGKGKKKKYPRINHVYKSMNIENLYFAGTNTHSLDWRKSAGGFIHGFRYTTRVLHRHLEWHKHGIPWPAVRLPVTELLNTLLRRINEASGIYQMFHILGDAIIIDENGLEFEYLQEVPIHRLYKETFYSSFGRNASRLMVLVLEYGPDFSGAGKDIFRTDRATGEPSEGHMSNFLHPVVYYFHQLPSIKDLAHKTKDFQLPPPTKIHHMVEDFTTVFDGVATHIRPLRRFIEHSLGHDLKYYSMEQCFHLALTNSNLPLSCSQHFMNGEGLASIPIPTMSPVNV